MMKFISIFFLVITVSVSSIFAQSFEDALELYNEDQFEEAAAIFSQINDQRSHLFAGKSYLALAEFPSANLYLTQALSGSIESVRQEAQYSFALSLYETKNFSQSLTLLHELSESQNRTGLRNDARRFYNQILDYLSENQRFEVLLKLNSQTIQFDLVTRSRSYLDIVTYQLLVSELLKTTKDSEEIRRIESELMTTTGLNRTLNTFPSAPIGTVYNVGVILPEFDENDPDFTIPRNLYFGMVLAASDFNSKSIDQKVRLHFRNSAENPDTTAKAFKELVWSKRADAVMGPLFSEPATRMARLAEDYQIPMVAPLANSDDLNRDY
ncbi:MAG: ABC transporter substrate-binding protein, partial [Balneolaceae bacterium]